MGVLVARIFQGGGGGHTESYIGYSPDCHLNIVGCLLTKRLTKGGHEHPRTPWLRRWFAERVLVQNVLDENDLIFMQMNVQVTYIFIPIVSHKDSFCHKGKSKLGIGLFIHELAGSL